MLPPGLLAVLILLSHPGRPPECAELPPRPAEHVDGVFLARVVAVRVDTARLARSASEVGRPVPRDSLQLMGEVIEGRLAVDSVWKGDIPAAILVYSGGGVEDTHFHVGETYFIAARYAAQRRTWSTTMCTGTTLIQSPADLQDVRKAFHLGPARVPAARERSN